jgi:DNA-binding transcriptional LysR family regulator
MDRFEELQTFVRVAEALSVTRAAGQLGIAASAVSRRVRDLEERLGTQLFHRTTRRIALTETGRDFHARAVRILADLDDAEADASNAAQAISGTLRLAISVSLGLAALNREMADFLAEHPQLVIDVDVSDRRVDLVAEGIDLAIRIGRLDDSSLIARKISEARHVITASPDFLAKHGMPRSLEDLRDLPALCYSNVERPEIWFFYEPDGRRIDFEVTPRMIASNGDALRDAAVAGLGINASPSFIVHRQISEGTLVPILTDLYPRTSGIYAVYPPSRHLPARARAFVDFLAERIGPVPYWENCLKLTPNSS